MNLLLDTHAILWLVEDDKRLTASARKKLQQADQIYFSAISFWEIAIKNSNQRANFTISKNWATRIENELRSNGATQIPIEIRHCALVEKLPQHHQDPFDRLLIAQAISEKLTILTRDKHIPCYKVKTTW